MKRLVVVGNGMVGHRLVQAVHDRDADRSWHITVIGEEPGRAYDRVALSSLFADAVEENLHLDGHDVYDGDPRVSHLGDAVTAVDRVTRTVETASGRTVPYDELVLATGSYPFVPPVPGSDLPGVFVYRTLADVAKIREYAQGRTRGVVVGGGLLGLEAAGALAGLGLAVTIVEFADRLMPLQVDAGGAEMLRRRISDAGYDVRLNTAVRAVHPDASGRAARVIATHDDEESAYDTDLVVFATGVRPQDTLARDAGLAIGARGGVVVDGHCRTSDAAISAIGECVCLDGTIYGLVAPGYAMAEAVAQRLTAGIATPLGIQDVSTTLKLLGVAVASFGDAHATTPGALSVAYADPIAGVYKRLVISDDAHTVLGGVLVGDAGGYPTLRALVGQPLPGDPQDLLFDGAGGLDAGALPDSAQICSCRAVGKGTICQAITAQSLTDVPGVKQATGAGTVCGSCVPILKRLLVDSGVEVSTALCEHFGQTRAQLFDIVRLTGITSFTDLISRHGTGRGCDICKPVVASILASLERLDGEHILAGEQAALQDTNDKFLANIQKNGTYSVVPRIAGGEITPDGLIVIGEVARDFGLYTKITGGQRIDMFGATVEQLPQIWRRLVGAGFESGHAYGKALRTVKSCVGSDWCRYGVQDAVGLAVDLELRYRGLRSPHKMKSGVSGCGRECAEAQAKDFGVVATEDGWNLYVGGNGGARPRHAELLLADVDTETLVRTIDRFIMFYIRTADRLQRTATWLENLEGGLDYLRSVIVDDSLGVGAELDAAMARHVASYRDEWAAVLDDPEQLRKFTSFVNAPGVPDPDIEFVSERGQPKPVGLIPRQRRLIAGPTLEVVRR